MGDMNLENINTDSTQQSVDGSNVSNGNNGNLTKGAKVVWFILGFCIPLVGLILWLVWGKEYPEKSHYCRNGFIAGVVSFIAIYILIFVFSMIMMATIPAEIPT
ncbi:MAG: PLDc N-terminal domain-containing protein [bacterium]|nr:PLDc N-terminal domain-containing protein [bacterium]